MTAEERTLDARSEGSPRTPAAWEVRPFRPSEVPGLLELYRLVFGRERSEADLRWKLLRPAQVDTLWVADDHGKVVGQHAGVPARVKLGSRVVPAIHAVEAMTHPDYRKQGMLTKVGGGLYRYWGEQGIPLIYGLPNDQWGTRAHAVGYEDTFPVRWLSRPLRPQSIMKSRLAGAQPQPAVPHRGALFPPRRLGTLTVEARSAAGPEFDEMWRSLGAKYENCVVRDSQWVQYRFLDSPEGHFTVLAAFERTEPRGYIAYRLVRIGPRLIGRVADVFWDPDDRASQRALISSALQSMKKQGADSAATLVAVGTPAHKALARQGFLLKRGEHLANFITPTPEVSLADVNDATRWHMMGGDFDVI